MMPVRLDYQHAMAKVLQGGKLFRVLLREPQEVLASESEIICLESTLAQFSRMMCHRITHSMSSIRNVNGYQIALVSGLGCNNCLIVDYLKAHGSRTPCFGKCTPFLRFHQNPNRIFIFPVQSSENIKYSPKYCFYPPLSPH